MKKISVFNNLVIRCYSVLYKKNNGKRMAALPYKTRRTHFGGWQVQIRTYKFEFYLVLKSSVVKCFGYFGTAC
jgi:hypothetical protein